MMGRGRLAWARIGHDCRGVCGCAAPEASWARSPGGPQLRARQLPPQRPRRPRLPRRRRPVRVEPVRPAAGGSARRGERGLVPAVPAGPVRRPRPHAGAGPARPRHQRRHRRAHPRAHHRPRQELPAHRQATRAAPRNPPPAPQTEKPRTQMRVRGHSDVLRHHMGALGGNRTPNLLIRRSGRVVQNRPLRSARWADIPQLSARGGCCPAAWQQYWQQSRHSGTDPRPSANSPAIFRHAVGLAWPTPCCLGAAAWILVTL